MRRASLHFKQHPTSRTATMEIKVAPSQGRRKFLWQDLLMSALAALNRPSAL